MYVKEEMKKNNISEQTVIGIIWSSVMSTVEWNKKEELVAEQAIKHLKVFCGYSDIICVSYLVLTQIFRLRHPSAPLNCATPFN